MKKCSTMRLKVLCLGAIGSAWSASMLLINTSIYGPPSINTMDGPPTIFDHCPPSCRHGTLTFQNNGSASNNITTGIEKIVNSSTGDHHSTSSSSCCYQFQFQNLTDKFTPEYFEEQRTKKLPSGTSWTGREYEEWQQISKKLELDVRASKLTSKPEDNTGTENSSCEAQWKYTVLNEMDGFYLRRTLDSLRNDEENPSFSYVPPLIRDGKQMPRILVLGDSISRGVWVESQSLSSGTGGMVAPGSIQGAPTNCGGFENYKMRITNWLGGCPWDLVQFNIGMHFNGSNMVLYVEQLKLVVGWIRKHSPAAHVVFALTTPSPFDSNTTWPSIETCKDYHRFHKPGYVAKINQAAKSSLVEINVTINDRYSVIQPVLHEYQRPCDVHYQEGGYQFLAKQDLQVFAKLLR